MRGAALILALLAATGAAGQELLRLGDAPRVGEVVAWRLPGAPTASLDVGENPRLTIAAPDGTVVERPAFVYQEWAVAADGATAEYVPRGERELRIRHTFRAAGAHALRLLAADGRELRRRRITVAADPDHHGPIGISPHNPRLLAYADGTPWIPIGCNIAWATGDDRLAAMRRYFARLADAGGNHARVWCASWCGQIEGERPDTYRLDQAWLLDRILAAARAHGIGVTLVLDNHHDLAHGAAFPYGDDAARRAERFLAAPLPPAYQRRLGYLLARYGADDAIVAWELFNEVDLAFNDHHPAPAAQHEALATRWVEAAGSWLHAHDPDRRLVTVSLANANWPAVFRTPAVDLIQVHSYVPDFATTSPFHHDGIALLADAMLPYATIGKPLIAGEVGHHGTEGDVPGHAHDQRGALLRQQAWAGLLLGGYGSGMNWWWDVAIDRHDLWSVYRGPAAAVAHIDWTDTDLQPILPNDGGSLRVIGWRSRTQALLWPQLRSDTWFRLADGRGPARYPHRGPTIRIPGLAPDRIFRVRGLDRYTGAVAWTAHGRSDARGGLAIGLAAEAPRQVLVLDAR